MHEWLVTINKRYGGRQLRRQIVVTARTFTRAKWLGRRLSGLYGKVRIQARQVWA